jgi:predicted transcriptional regulator
LSIYRLMVSVNLSYKLLKSCLEELAASNLISMDVKEKKTIVSTTQEGMKAVTLYHSAISSLRGREEGNARRKYPENRAGRETSSGIS